MTRFPAGLSIAAAALALFALPAQAAQPLPCAPAQPAAVAAPAPCERPVPPCAPVELPCHR
ncbi:MAG: hypothetical protein ACK55H_09085 [Cyanobacteriota bacterium]|jgi:hypothetical protein